MKILLATLCVLSGLFAARIDNHAQLIHILESAKSVELRGKFPEDSRNFTALPIRINSRQGVIELAEFFKKQKITFDADSTRALKDGAVLGTAIAFEVIIDDRYRFNILASDLVILSKHQVYIASSDRHSYFSKSLVELASTLSNKQKKD